MVRIHSVQDQTMGKSHFLVCTQTVPFWNLGGSSDRIVNSSSKLYLNGYILVDNDGIHSANTRQCTTRIVASGLHQIYLVGFEAAINSELEVTYSGPDTHGIRTLIGSDPIYSDCDPWNPASQDPVFVLCTYKSDPTSAWDGDCMPTEGIEHPRYPGPCAKAIGTDSENFNYFSGGYYVPVLGSANQSWVSARRVPFYFKLNLC